MIQEDETIKRSFQTVKAEIVHQKRGSIKASNGKWYNPTNEDIENKVKKDVQGGDVVVLETSDNGKGHFNNHRIIQINPDQDIEEERLTNHGTISDSHKESSDQKKPGTSPQQTKTGGESEPTPCVRIVTRAGSLNTAIQILENTGYQATNPDEYLSEAIRLRNNIIRSTYKNSKEERSDKKHKERKNKTQ